MLFIWGHRYYGQIDGQDGQCSMTRFAHGWFLPLFPMSSMWRTVQSSEVPAGHPMRLSLAGVLHGYLRTWGLFVGVVMLLYGAVTPSLGAAGVGAGALAIAGLSMHWRKLRDPRRRRRARYTLMTIGTGCDPLRMPRLYASHLRAQAENRWLRTAGALTPDDVVRRGAASLEQAAAAYTLLRLVARLETGARARAARATSEEILDATTDLKLDATPYRDELPAPPPT